MAGIDYALLRRQVSLAQVLELVGFTVTFEDGTIQQAFLSWKGFRQLLSLKANRTPGNDSKVAGKLPDAKTAQG